jgi:septum formation protein
MKKLFLASASRARKKLLEEAGIACTCAHHTADERSCPWTGKLEDLTGRLAQLKMAHVVLPAGAFDGQICFVLTADTLTRALAAGEEHNDAPIIGKPQDHADAIAIIKRVRDGITCTTGFCLERRVWCDGVWQTQQQYTGFASGWCSLAIADDEIEDYFVHLKKYSGYNYLALAGAFSITGYGMQFLKEVRGSYSAILGLPMLEIQVGLKEIGFYEY